MLGPMTTELPAMFENVQKVVDHWLFKVVSRGAMVVTLGLLGYAAGLINNVSSRTTTLETSTAEIRRDVDAIDARAIDRAELSDERAAVTEENWDNVNVKIDTLDNKVDALSSRLSEMSGILSQMQRQAVARTMSRP